MSGEAAGDQHGAGTGIGSGGAAGSPSALPRSSADARAAVLALLERRFCAPAADWRETVVVADVLLVTSELVTNANRHGGGLTRFSAEIDGDALRLYVGDASPEPPVSPSGPDAAEDMPRIGGYGWQMVCRLAHEVTVVTHRAGKTISAVLPLV
ncbi:MULTISPECIES: ATP-binding protein [unclassified Streptomyces]|uniref:ATP-binding protein n=1 Tax=unclassified Streptomyces TaxID=2593676 RepID=UPI0034502312